MGTQNFDAFKPLNEEEEKQIKGGGNNGPTNVNQACAPILEEIQIVGAKIAASQSQSGSGFVDPSLLQLLNSLQAKYSQCMNTPRQPGN